MTPQVHSPAEEELLAKGYRFVVRKGWVSLVHSSEVRFGDVDTTPWSQETYGMLMPYLLNESLPAGFDGAHVLVSREGWWGWVPADSVRPTDITENLGTDDIVRAVFRDQLGQAMSAGDAWRAEVRARWHEREGTVPAGMAEYASFSAHSPFTGKPALVLPLEAYEALERERDDLIAERETLIGSKECVQDELDDYKGAHELAKLHLLRYAVTIAELQLQLAGVPGALGLARAVYADVANAERD